MVFDSLRRKYVALTPEEWVRQHFVHFLMEHKDYPAGLLANEVELKIGDKRLRCDSLLYNKEMKPQMIIFAPVFGCTFIVDFILMLASKKTKKAFLSLGGAALGTAVSLVLPCIPYFKMGMADVALFGKTLKLPWIFSLFLGTIAYVSSTARILFIISRLSPTLPCGRHPAAKSSSSIRRWRSTTC